VNFLSAHLGNVDDVAERVTVVRHGVATCASIPALDPACVQPSGDVDHALRAIVIVPGNHVVGQLVASFELIEGPIRQLCFAPEPQGAEVGHSSIVHSHVGDFRVGCAVCVEDVGRGLEGDGLTLLVKPVNFQKQANVRVDPAGF